MWEGWIHYQIMGYRQQREMEIGAFCNPFGITDGNWGRGRRGVALILRGLSKLQRRELERTRCCCRTSTEPKILPTVRTPKNFTPHGYFTTQLFVMTRLPRSPTCLEQSNPNFPS